VTQNYAIHWWTLACWHRPRQNSSRLSGFDDRDEGHGTGCVFPKKGTYPAQKNTFTEGEPNKIYTIIFMFYVQGAG